MMEDSSISDRKGPTNPQEKTISNDRSSPTNKPKAQNIFQEIQSLLDNHEFAVAKSLAREDSTLEGHVHSQLFKADLLRILSHETQSDELLTFINYSEDLTPKENQILEMVLKLKERKSINSMLVKVIGRKLEDIIRGVETELTAKDQLFKYGDLAKKIEQPLRMIETMLKKNESEKILELKRYYQKQMRNVSSLKGRLESFERENQAFLKKERLLKQKTKQLSEQLQNQLTANIKLQIQLNEQKDAFVEEKQRARQQYSDNLKELNELVDKHLNAGVVYAQIGVTIKDMKDLILKLNQQNRILNDERDCLNQKLTFIEEEISKRSSKEETQQEDRTKDLEAKISLQEQTIAQLHEKLRELQQIHLNDSHSVSNSSFSLEDSRNKPKISRNNVQRLTEGNKKKEEEIQKLRQQLEEKDKTIADLEDKLKESITFDLADSLTISENSFKMNESTTKQIKINKSSLERLTEDNKRKEEEIVKLNEVVKDYVLQLTALKEKTPEEKNQELEVKIVLTEEALAQEENKVKRLQEEHTQLRQTQHREIEQLQDKIVVLQKQLQSEKEQKMQKIQQHTTEMNSQRKENDSLNKKIKSLQQFVKTLQENSRKEQAQFEGALLQMKEREERLHQSMKEMEKSSPKQMKAGQGSKDSPTKETEALLTLKEQQYNQLLVEYDIIFSQKEQIASKLKTVETMLQFSKNKQKDSDSKCIAAEKKLKTILADEKFRKSYPQYQVDHLFSRDILDSAPQSKVFLKQVIQNKYNKSIFRTKLLYYSDPYNSTSFHKYIDQKDCLLLIVELVNGNIIAGYYNGKIYPKMIADKDALLISITNREVFELMQTNKRGVSYDELFFIFGNSEIKLKPSEMKFFSNFGLGNGDFRHRGHKIHTLTGLSDKEREVECTNIEIYQVQYL